MSDNSSRKVCNATASRTSKTETETETMFRNGHASEALGALPTRFRRVTQDDSFGLMAKLKFLQTLENSSSPIHKELLSVLMNDKRMKMTLNRCTNNQLIEHYFVTIQCHNDDVLIKYGKQFGLPRGCHVLWVPGHPVRHIAGFLPKYDNAALDNPDSDEMIKAVKQAPYGSDLFASLKLSGSLGMLTAYALPGHGGVCYTAFSKNSACMTNTYVRDITAMFEKVIGDDPTIPTRMLSMGIPTLCAEVMLPTDQVHGACVSDGGGVVVTAGFAPHDAHHMCPPNPRWRDLAEELGFDISPGVHLPLSDEASRHRLMGLLARLSAERDSITLGLVEQILGTDMEVHRRILGDVLEGLVLILTRPDGTRVIVKFKCVNYVWRTMALRNLMKAFADGDRGAVSRPALEKFALKFAHRWCSSVEGKRLVVNAICGVMLAWVDDDGWLRSELLPQQEHTGVACHILAADLYDRHPASFERYYDPSSVYMTMDGPSAAPSAAPFARVIIITGPLASGKTILGELLAKLIGLGATSHVDGDNVSRTDGGNINVTPHLGKMRASATIFRIIDLISMGILPIVSCGGGVLFDMQGRFLLDDAMRSMGFAGVKFDLVVVPGRAPGAEDADPNQEDSFADLSYTSSAARQAMANSIEHRKWTVDPSKLADKMSGNVKFYSALLSLLTRNDPDAKALSANDSVAIQRLIDHYVLEQPGPNTAFKDLAFRAKGYRAFIAVLPPHQKGGPPIVLHMTTDHSNNHGGGGGGAGATIPVAGSDDRVPSRVIGHSCTFVPRCATTANADEQQGGQDTQGKQDKQGRQDKQGKQGKKGNKALGSFVYFPQLGDGAHVTVNPSPFLPHQMKCLARALDSGETTTHLRMDESDENSSVAVDMTMGKQMEVQFVTGPPTFFYSRIA